VRTEVSPDMLDEFQIHVGGRTPLAGVERPRAL
jgi:hypothetical protein